MCRSVFGFLVWSFGFRMYACILVWMFPWSEFVFEPACFCCMCLYIVFMIFIFSTVFYFFVESSPMYRFCFQ